MYGWWATLSHDSLIVLLEAHPSQLRLESPHLLLLERDLVTVTHQLHVVLQLTLTHLGEESYDLMGVVWLKHHKYGS